MLDLETNTTFSIYYFIGRFSSIANKEIDKNILYKIIDFLDNLKIHFVQLTFSKKNNEILLDLLNTHLTLQELKNSNSTIYKLLGK